MSHDSQSAARSHVSAACGMQSNSLSLTWELVIHLLLCVSVTKILLHMRATFKCTNAQTCQRCRLNEFWGKRCRKSQTNFLDLPIYSDLDISDILSFPPCTASFHTSFVEIFPVDYQTKDNLNENTTCFEEKKTCLTHYKKEKVKYPPVHIQGKSNFSLKETVCIQ